MPPDFAGEPSQFLLNPTPGTGRDIQTQKKMSTCVDILFALQVGLEPTTP